jgi:4-alpha-glucanotransferase
VTAARDEAAALRRLADALGVATEFVDGLGRTVRPGDETLIAVCAALGAPVTSGADAPAALRQHVSEESRAVPPVLVAWDGNLTIPSALQPARGEIRVGSGDDRVVEGGACRPSNSLPVGYHTLVLDRPRPATITVISAPVRSFPLDPSVRWGLAAQLAALRTDRSRSIADLDDLRTLTRWTADHGGGLVSLLPLLPTFNDDPPEPSPYSPVSRLFWNELHLNLHGAHRPVEVPGLLDFGAADREVRNALRPARVPHPDRIDSELARYARFRGAQARLGRAWMTWPAEARRGSLRDTDVDPEEERFHLVAQQEMREQLASLTASPDDGPLLGLDLAVGVHPDGYDVWSRQELFAPGMSVGAPPDAGFPSGQNWGFPPVLPGASRAEAHRYVADSIAHQAGLAGVLRIDHVMALRRLYWIPSGADLADGTYVQYPLEELFAVVCVESHRHRCAIVGENLGTVPPEIDTGLARHGVLGMYLAQFEAGDSPKPSGPDASEAALINTHDTPSLAGWIDEVDIDERLRVGLLDETSAVIERTNRSEAVAGLAGVLKVGSDPVEPFLEAILGWLGSSDSPLVSVALEDLWLEPRSVNIPGTASDRRPNWRRPWARSLEEIAVDPAVLARLSRLARARARATSTG